MRILIAADGSLGTGAACDWLARFRWNKEDRAAVISVVPEIRSLTGRIDRSMEESHDRVVVKETTDAEKIVHECAIRLAPYFGTVETRVHAGSPADEILDAANEIGADLIIVGRHGKSLFKGWLLGSVSQAVLQRASCSVLVARSNSDLVSRIVLAYDGSPESEEALRWTGILAKSAGYAEVLVVSVAEPVPVVTSVYPFYLPGDYYSTAAALEDERRTLMADQARMAAERLAADGVAARTTVRFGTAGAEILDVAASETPGLIVVGAHAPNTWSDFVISNSALQAVKGATCSVLIARSISPEVYISDQCSSAYEAANEDVILEGEPEGHEGSDETVELSPLRR